LCQQQREQASESTQPKVDLSQQPIAYIGHGAMFDRDGVELELTPQFANRAEQFYLDALLSSADENTRVAYQKRLSRLLKDKDWDARTEFLIKATVLERLLSELRPMNNAQIWSKHRFLRNRVLAGFEPPPIVKELLTRELNR